MKEFCESIKNFIGLQEIDEILFYSDLENNVSCECECDYHYLFIQIKIDLQKQDSYDYFLENIFHEFCHYFTAIGQYLIHPDEKWATDIVYELGKKAIFDLVNKMTILEEQMVVRLSRAFIKLYKKTKDYKKYQKLFSKYF